MEATLQTDVFPPPPFEPGHWRSEAGKSSLSASESESHSPAASSLQPPAYADHADVATTGLTVAPVENASPSAPACPILRALSQSAGGAQVRAICINLDRRPDRWEQFLRNCPLAGVERFPAIDGRRCRPPTWWRQGGGARGCMLSHLRILEQALMDGLSQRGGVLLVLEDDALFPPDFAEKAERFIAALPRDWEQVYFGGQHRALRIRPPRRINTEVIRPYMVNRTQAYAVRGHFILTLYRHLCDWPAHARRPRHHVDHRMELLHASGRHNVYAPTRWIIGQAGGKSDVSGRMAQDRFWNYHVAERPAKPNRPKIQRRVVRRPPVWVIGVHRSGSSVTAGILHRLGVHMGNRLGGYENRGTGGFEARGLAKICEQAYPFPATEPKADLAVTKRRLRRWLDHRMREAAHRATLAGGKYPHLCFLVDVLLELEPESRVIHIDRPLDESIRSLTDRSAKARSWLRATPEQCDRLQRALDASKRDALARVSPDRVLTLHYHELLVDAASPIDRIIEFLGLQVRAEQRQAAIALVEPSRRNF